MSIPPEAGPEPAIRSRPPRSVFVLNVLLTTGAAALAAVGADLRHPFETPAWVLVPLAVALVIAGRLRLTYRYHSEVEDLDMFEAVLAPVLLLFDVPTAVLLAAAAKAASELWARVAFTKAWFNVAQWALATAAGGVTFALLTLDTSERVPSLLPLAAAMVVVVIVNHASFVAVMTLVMRSPPVRVLRELGPAIGSGWLLSGSINLAFGLLMASAAIGTPSITPLFVLPLGALHLASKRLTSESTDRGLRRAVHDVHAALNRSVHPRDAVEPFLVIVADAFVADAAALVLMDEEGLAIHHVGPRPGRIYHRWEGPAGGQDLMPLATAGVVSPGDDGLSAVLPSGWSQCLAAPLHVETATSGVLCVLDPQGYSRQTDANLATLEALASAAAGSFARATLLEAVLAAHRRQEVLLGREGQVLESIASDEDLATSLLRVVEFVEDVLSPARCAIAIASPSRSDEAELEPIAAPPGPEDIAPVLVVGDGPRPPHRLLATLAGDEIGSELIIVAEVGLDDRWEAGIDQGWERFPSCWVVPVKTAYPPGRRGAIFVALPETRDAGDAERDALAVARRLARLALERSLARSRLKYQAHHDRLTGLPNRTAFLEDVDIAIARGATTDATGFCVLFVDLDRFKTVNDSMGHDAGDALLVAVARRLQSVVRPTDTVARLGGDEFTVLCENGGGRDGAESIAKRLVTALRDRYVVKDLEVVVPASIGVAVAEPGLGSAELIERADAAMYRAKQLGRNRVEVFDLSTRNDARRRLFEHNALRQALDRGDFVVHYQPERRLDDLSVVAVEALVRRRQPDGSIVEPEQFIDLAEESGLIVPLGALVLSEACKQVRAWRHDERYRSLAVSVNLSPRQFSQGDVVDMVRRALHDNDLPPEALTLEITENALIEARETADSLRDLKNLGVVIALDDFGTGYSSLNYLRHLPIDVMKIDRVFVQELGIGSVTTAIVGAVIELARTLGLSVVAEGIETEDQLRRLRDLGCPVGQGYYLGAAVEHGALDLGPWKRPPAQSRKAVTGVRARDRLQPARHR